ncbi:MAG: hypothetical protein WD872_21500 [Pirellulaceae bacterium]
MDHLCRYLALSSLLLAAGCCLPALGGRYEEQSPSADQCEHARRERGLGLRGERNGERHWPWNDPNRPGTPPGTTVPMPHFHPVPTRPVFEPQFDYSLPQALAPLLVPEADGGAILSPVPAKPIPDPA